MPAAASTLPEARVATDATEHRLDTTLVRALAVLLVTNSHLEHFYPYPWLAGDGLLGNSLFFLLAGYGLVRSGQRAHRSFAAWLRRRVERIYPALVPVVLVFGVLIEAGWRHWTPGEYLRQFVWPTRYTFVELVMPFYLVFFPFLRWGRARAFAAGVWVLALIYLAAYATDVRHMPPSAPLHLGERSIWMHAAAYFQVMLLGGWLALAGGESVPRAAAHPATSALICAAYLATKFAMVTGTGARAYPALYVLTFAFCFCAFALLTDAAVVHRARHLRRMWIAATFVAGLTLEIYLVHTYLTDYAWLAGIVFPLNLAVFWLLTLPLAAAGGRVAERLQAVVGERPRVSHQLAAARPADDLGASA